jgi:hypothetical protein
MTRLLFKILLPHAPEHLLGDLEEEAPSQSRFWLLRQVLQTAAHQSNLLESAAAAAFLTGIPLALLLELRRYTLTLIPHRESAAFSPLAFTLLALALAALSAFRPRPQVLLAALFTAVIVTLTGAPLILAAAPLLGGALTKPKQRTPNP